MLHSKSAYSLIELLVCIVIIMILTSISVVSYYGALDNADLKEVLPRITSQIKSYKDMAWSERAIVTVEFVEGRGVMNVTVKGGAKPRTEQVNLESQGLLRRRLAFRNYKWPDGAQTPRTFTFIPNASPKGGEVWFGSGWAEGRIMIETGGVAYSLQ